MKLTSLQGLHLSGEESDALPCNRDACTSGEVQVAGDLETLLEVPSNSEAGLLRHPSLGAVPVDLEPFRVAEVQVVGGDEVEVLAVLVGADPLDDDRGQSRFGVNAADVDAVLGDEE